MKKKRIKKKYKKRKPRKTWGPLNPVERIHDKKKHKYNRKRNPNAIKFVEKNMFFFFEKIMKKLGYNVLPKANIDFNKEPPSALVEYYKYYR